MTEATETYDFIIVGSGGSAVCAALVMKEAGKRALIIEKRPFFGGSSALSGGVMWIPCNSLGREAGVEDTPEMAKAYLDACAGPESKGSSAARRAAFLEEAPKAIDFLRAKGMQLVHGEGYSDYHETEYPGGVARSRSVMPEDLRPRRTGRQGRVDRLDRRVPADDDARDLPSHPLRARLEEPRDHAAGSAGG